MKVAVLGCGPAGLLAAWAALNANPKELTIFSAERKQSQIAGAQYLHLPIRGITGAAADFIVKYEKIGTRDNYNIKVYGEPTHRSSWDRWNGYRPAWKLRQAYDTLWSALDCFIEEELVDHELLQTLCRKYDVIFSTIPVTAICKGSHIFSQEAVIIGDGLPFKVEPDTIIYNGVSTIPWHRASNIEGEVEYEFRSHSEVKIPEALQNRRTILKPQETNCNCYPKIIRLGRYGKWRRDTLVSDAYAEAGEWV